ncbi:MAG: DUF4097 family beta strand repeat-containing protein [Pyrinomonadaceae bacterium]
MSQRIVNRMALLLSALLLASAGVYAQGANAAGELREEFHQSYPLSAQGRITLKNISGAVRITAWDRAEVRLDAVKRANARERLEEARIVVNASADSLNVETRYPEGNLHFNRDREYYNAASVDYTLSVPRGARLESIEVISGQLDIEGITGGVKASCISGRFTARNLAGDAKLSNVSGRLEAIFDRLDETSTVSLNNVSGATVLTIPADTNGHIKANTLSGSITNDLGLPVRRGEYVGNDMSGQLGSGGARIRVSSVSGPVKIQRAADGRTASSVTNLLSDTRSEREGASREEIERQVEREIARAMQQTEREVERTNRVAERSQRAKASREAAILRAERSEREVERAAVVAERANVQMAREVERAAREVERAFQEDGRVIVEGGESSYRLVERESKSFTVGGTPRVLIKTFDGSINIQPTDQSTVSFTAVKRARDEQAMRGIRLRAEQTAEGVNIIAEFDKTREQRHGTGAAVMLDVYIPRRANVQVKSGDGRLRLSGIDGEIELNTGDGSVEVSDGKGQLRVQTGDGRVRVSNFDGAATVQTGDGRISLDGRFSQLSARTGDGAISLALPADANARIETDSERVINDLAAIAEEPETETSERRVRHWRVGSGAGGQITLRTGDGHIFLRRAGADR